MTDLSLVPTDDLVGALKARFDYMIFAGVQDHAAATGEHAQMTAWSGHVTFCAGMATDLIREMQDYAREPEDDA